MFTASTSRIISEPVESFTETIKASLLEAVVGKEIVKPVLATKVIPVYIKDLGVPLVAKFCANFKGVTALTSSVPVLVSD